MPQNFCKITTLDLSYIVTDKSMVEILQNFVAFSKLMNFISTKGPSARNWWARQTSVLFFNGICQKWIDELRAYQFIICVKHHVFISELYARILHAWCMLIVIKIVKFWADKITVDKITYFLSCSGLFNE